MWRLRLLALRRLAPRPRPARGCCSRSAAGLGTFDRSANWRDGLRELGGQGARGLVVSIASIVVLASRAASRYAVRVVRQGGHRLVAARDRGRPGRSSCR